MKKNKSDLQVLKERLEAEEREKHLQDQQQTEYSFGRFGKHTITASFSADDVTGNAGLLPLMEMADRIEFFDPILEWIPEYRAIDKIQHTKDTIVKQYTFGHVTGDHNLIDHNSIRHDPIYLSNLVTQEKIAVHGTKPPLPGKDTIQRFLHSILELPDPKAFLDRIGANLTIHLIRLLVASWDSVPEEIVIDCDSTDVQLHGDQEGKKYNPHYDGNIYHLQLAFIDGMPLAFKYVTADHNGAYQAKTMWTSIVNELRQLLGNEVPITLRGDCAFCQNDVMTWVENKQKRGHNTHYALGQTVYKTVDELAQRVHQKLTSDDRMGDMKDQCLKTKQAVKDYVSIRYRPEGGNKVIKRRKRSVAMKLEFTFQSRKKEDNAKWNPRGVVHSFGRDADPEEVYTFYCQRGTMENWIKEGKNGVDYKHASLHQLPANEFAGFFKVAAHGLIEIFRKSLLKGTVMEKFTVESIRAHLIKIGAKVNNSKRRFHLDMTNSYVHKEVFAKVCRNLPELAERIRCGLRAPT